MFQERRVKYGVISEMKRQQVVAQPGVMRPGVVKGEPVIDILLDSGCSRTIESKVKEGEAVACGVSIGIRFCILQQITVEAAVSNTLPLSVYVWEWMYRMGRIVDR